MIKITKLDGSPFATKLAAKAAGGRQISAGKIEADPKVVSVEGGYILEAQEKVIASPIEEPAKSIAQVETPANIVVPAQEEEKKDEGCPSIEAVGHWKEARLLSMIDKHKVPGRRYRWVNTKLDGSVEKHGFEGWVIDKDMYKKMQKLSLYTKNGSSLDGTTRIRELILMWMPEKLAEQRNSSYRDKANNRLAQDKDRLKNELQEKGGRMYGSIQMS
jgi:hypothetical protein